MRLIKRWWSEQLGQHIYLRADNSGGYHLTVSQELQFATEAEARQHAADLMAQAPDGKWRHQPL